MLGEVVVVAVAVVFADVAVVLVLGEVDVVVRCVAVMFGEIVVVAGRVVAVVFGDVDGVVR